MMSKLPWEEMVEEANEALESIKRLRSLRPIIVSKQNHEDSKECCRFFDNDNQPFDRMCLWDRSCVEVSISNATLHKWLKDIPSIGDEIIGYEDASETQNFKVVLFSGNDYLGLSAHPAVRNAVAKTARDCGMGPRGGALICGYTNYHGMLERTLADLKQKEDCLLCPTGFAANMALLVAVSSAASILANGKPSKKEKVAVFSDSLNHASIIDGIRLAERLGGIEGFVYRHNDTNHLEALLSRCTMKRKVVVTDSLFSMDGDFAPLPELAMLRKKYGFLLIIDDAHATLVCGKNGRGAAEQFDCEGDVDICVGTLSKAAGCVGGFIACSKSWKQLIQSRGRAFVFSTSLPIPMAAAAHAAITVGRKEAWRRKAVWDRVREFSALSGISFTSPIVSLIVGNEETALQASRHLLKSGFHVTAIRPPTVPPNSCRLRVALSAAHTSEDVKRLVAALSHCLNFKDIINRDPSLTATAKL